MTAEELAASISGGPVTLLLDTNALYADREEKEGIPAGRLDTLCDQANLINARYGYPTNGRRITLQVSAAAHAEKLFDLKQEFGARYNARKIAEGMLRKGLHVSSFEERHAERLALTLGEKFPDGASWRSAKRRSCLQCLGLADLDNLERCEACGRPGRAPGSGRHCGKTVDWLIRAHAEEEGWVLVTNDRKWEFQGVAKKISLESTERAFQLLLAGP